MLARQRRVDEIADELGGSPPDESNFRDASTAVEPAAQASSAFLRVIGERFSL
jgi:hypothetical protein